MIRLSPARRRLFLDPGEEALLRAIAEANDPLPVRMDVFLQRHFFNETAGRALILQPAGGFGYFYLRRDLFDQRETLTAEISAMLDLFTLIARLRLRRLIYLFPTEPAENGDMLFVSDVFRDPKAGTAPIILNERGDYTFEPDRIQNDDGDVICRGVRLDGDIYALVREQTRGLIYLPPDLRARLAAPPPPAPPVRRPSFWRRHMLALFVLFVLGASLADVALWLRYS